MPFLSNFRFAWYQQVGEHGCYDTLAEHYGECIHCFTLTPNFTKLGRSTFPELRLKDGLLIGRTIKYWAKLIIFFKVRANVLTNIWLVAKPFQPVQTLTPGPNATKLLTSVIYKCWQKARVLVTRKNLHPCLMFARRPEPIWIKQLYGAPI